MVLLLFLVVEAEAEVIAVDGLLPVTPPVDLDRFLTAGDDLAHNFLLCAMSPLPPEFEDAAEADEVDPEEVVVGEVPRKLSDFLHLCESTSENVSVVFTKRNQQFEKL